MSEGFLTRPPDGPGGSPDSSVVSHPTPLGGVDVSPDGRRKSMRRAVREANASAARAAASDEAAWTPEANHTPSCGAPSPRGSPSPPSPRGAHPPQLYDRAPANFGFAGAGLYGYDVVRGHDTSLLDTPSLQTTFGLVRAMALPLAVLCPLLGVVLVLAALVIWTPGASVTTALGVGGREDTPRDALGGWPGFVCDEVAAASGDLRAGGWSAEELDWCCRVRGVGCTSTPWTDPRSATAGSAAAGGSTTAEDEYDCREGFQSWRDAWPDRKKDWCCYYYSRGCED